MPWRVLLLERSKLVPFYLLLQLLSTISCSMYTRNSLRSIRNKGPTYWSSRSYTAPGFRQSSTARYSQPHVMANNQSSNHNEAKATTQTTAEEGEEHKSVRPIGLLGPGSGATTLDVSSGQSVTLDHLGPMVVNTDGTISRINNWTQMTDMERQSTMRIIVKRNKARLDALKSREEQGGPK